MSTSSSRSDMFPFGLFPPRQAPELLPDSDQYVEVRDKITDYFSHSDTTDLITLKVRALREKLGFT